jgi:predicted transcriptional regulator
MDDYPQLEPGDEGGSSASEGGERDARRAELRAAVKRGLEDIEQGRVVDLEAALDRIEAMLDELDASKPA